MKTTRLRVMIVEGQPAHAEAIRRALKKSGTVWDIRVAGSLREFHESVASRTPDIVLMDMDLPDGRAVDVLTAPPEDAPFPILIMANHGDEKTAVETMKSGALDYIVKSPEAFAETPRMLVRALREWSLLKKAQRKDEQLRQSEERYRTITENMSDTVWVMDLDFKTTFISPSVLQTRGFTLEELQALPLDRHMTPESFKLASQALSEEMTPKKLAKKDLVISRQLDLEFYRKDGSTFWGDVVMTLVRDAEGKPKEIIGVGRDITEKRKFEGALKKAAEEWRATFDSITDLISILDADYRITRANKSLADFLKTSPKALIGRFCYEVIHGTKQPPSFCPRKKVLETKRSVEKEIFDPHHGIHLHISVSPIVDPKGVVLGSVHVMKNITERRRAEEALKESEERFRTITENMTDAVWVMDMKMKTTFISPSVLERGYTLDELNALPLSQNVAPESLEILTRAMAEELTPERLADKAVTISRSVELEIYRKDGTSFWTDSIVTLVRDAAGKPKEFIGVGRDITERKRAEEALRESEARVRTKLDAILSPEGDIGALDLADIIDVPAIQSLMDDFYKLTNIGVAISDISAKVLVATGWQDICTEFHRIHPETCKHCIESDIQLSAGVKLGTYNLYKCKNNMWDMATPIIVGDRHVGNLYLGQFFFSDESIDCEAFRSQAKKYGFDERQYMDALDRVPRWGRETVDSVMNFYTKLAKLISELSYGNIKLARALTERDTLLNSLGESERRYRLLAENATDVIFIINMDLRFSYVSPSVTRVRGFTVEEAMAQTAAEALAPDSLNVAMNAIKEELEIEALQSKDLTRTRTLELEETCKDGSTVWTETTFSSLRDEKDALVGFLGITRDITDRKRAEEALKKEQQDIMLILDSSPIVIFYKDREGKHIRVNKAFATGLGRTEEEIVGKTVFDLFSPEVAQSMTDSDQEVMKSGRLKLNITEYHESAGGIRWLQVDKIPIYDANNSVIGLAGFAQDITERKRAEEALRESEERFRGIAEVVPEAFFIYSLQTSRYEYLSPAFEALFGRSVAEHYENPQLWYEAVHPDDRDRVAMVVFDSLETGFAVDFRIVRPDGSIRWVFSRAFPARDEQGNILRLIGANQDITKRKAAEEALRESEERFKQVAENAGEWIWEVDADGLYTYASPIVEKILGYRPKEIVGKKYFYDFFHPEDRETFKAAALAAFAAKRPLREFINRNVHKNGQTVWLATSGSPMIDDKGTLLGYRGADTDITDRKRAEEALRESEEKFRSLFKTSRDFLSISNLEGTIIEVNDAALEFFGYSSEEIPRTLMYDLYADPKDRQRLINAVLKGGYVQNKEIRMKKKDGEIIDALVTANLIRDNHGNPIGFFGSARDVTEMRKLEHQLLQSEKLSAVGTMISGVAHELNNPLTSIIGNAQMLAKRDVPEDIKNKLGVILKESIRTSKIVAGLLSFAREHKPERKMIDIRDILTESVKLREYDVKVSNIDMRVSLSENIPKLYADPYHLQQVFINLINNARDVLVGQENAALSIRTYRKDDAVLIEFEDNGPGIPDTIAKKIFDPFFTTKEVGKGTGLGLSIAYGIVREHNGTISVESEPTKGAKFTVTLPIRDDIQPAVGTAKTTVKPPPGTRTVLVVEDEASLRDLLTEALTEDGFFVETASTGDEAISLVGERTYDAVISDIKMPGIGGRELYLYIQKNHPEIVDKIIFITGDILSKDTQSFLQITNNRFIEKPFNIDALVALLNDVLAG